MPKTHRITLPQWQRRAALAGATAVLLPIRERGIGASVCRNPWEVPCHYSPGDRLMCREQWGFRWAHGEALYAYRYGDPLAHHEDLWESPSRMRAEACRLWLRVVRVEALNVADINDTRAAALGCESCTPAAEARAWWASERGKSREDWAWFVEVKREERA